MQISSEVLKKDLDQLTQEQLQQVADFIAFLKFSNKRRRVFNSSQLTTLATEFTQEDQILAETGMSDYAAMLHQEDQL